MPMTVHHERDNVYRLEIRGVLQALDFTACQATLVAEMDRVGPVRLLFLLEDFQGWAPEDNWHDLDFYVRHGDRIERIAIVGDERWRDESLMFAADGLRRAPVEFFADGQAANARAWLLAG
jgi:hypothetical protein